MLPTTAGATYGDPDHADEGVEDGGMASPGYTKVVVYFSFGLASAQRDQFGFAEGRAATTPTRQATRAEEKERSGRLSTPTTSVALPTGDVGYLVANLATRPNCNCLF